MYRVSRNFPGTWNVLPVCVGGNIRVKGKIRTIPESGGTGKKTEQGTIWPRDIFILSGDFQHIWRLFSVS